MKYSSQAWDLSVRRPNRPRPLSRRPKAATAYSGRHGRQLTGAAFGVQRQQSARSNPGQRAVSAAAWQPPNRSWSLVAAEPVLSRGRWFLPPAAAAVHRRCHRGSVKNGLTSWNSECAGGLKVGKSSQPRSHEDTKVSQSESLSLHNAGAEKGRNIQVHDVRASDEPGKHSQILGEIFVPFESSWFWVGGRNLPTFKRSNVGQFRSAAPPELPPTSPAKNASTSRRDVPLPSGRPNSDPAGHARS